jgi:hypothetical protein
MCLEQKWIENRFLKEKSSNLVFPAIVVIAL